MLPNPCPPKSIAAAIGSLLAIPLLLLASEADTVDPTACLSRLFSGQPGRNKVSLGLWIAAPLTKQDLSHLDTFIKALPRSRAEVTAIAAHDRQLCDLLESLKKRGNSRVAIERDGRKLLDNASLDAVVFLGFLNEHQTKVSDQESAIPSIQALNRYVTWACHAGKDCLIVPGSLPWMQTAEIRENEAKDHPGSTAQKYRRIVWYAFEDKVPRLDEFIRAVETREEGEYQIRVPQVIDTEISPLDHESRDVAIERLRRRLNYVAQEYRHYEARHNALRVTDQHSLQESYRLLRAMRDLQQEYADILARLRQLSSQ